METRVPLAHGMYGSQRTPYYNDDFSRHFVLLVPEQRFMFCFIPKNGCSQFNLLINELNGFTSGRDMSEPWFRSNAVGKFGYGQKELERIMADKTWFKGVFLRDPLERLLSAFLSKCALGPNGTVEDDGKHCLNFVDDAKAKRLPELVDFAMGLRHNTTGLGIQDAHFRPQKDFCGGLDIAKYDYVGSFANELHDQVADMLRMAGFSDDKVQLADKYFSSEHAATVEANMLTNAASPKHFNTYFNTVDKITTAYDVYRHDYSLLSHAGAQNDSVCITSAIALDFEKFRILDWVAYHNLMGVNCFMLFIDRERSNLADVDAALVYEKLVSTPQVFLLDVNDTKERIPEPKTMRKLMSVAQARFLAPFDADELAVIDPNMQDPEAHAWMPPSLAEFAANVMKQQPDAVGIYLHRLDFGTSGFLEPPMAGEVPGFALFTERSNRINKKGKPILDMHSGVEFIGVHTWGLDNRRGKQGVMLLPNGSAFKCKNTCLCPDKDTVAPEKACLDLGSCVEEDCNIQDYQAATINHYMTGSLAECILKLENSVWGRRSERECERFHKADGFTRDLSLMPYVTAIIARKRELFGQLSFEFEKSLTGVNLQDMGVVAAPQDRALLVDQ